MMGVWWEETSEARVLRPSFFTCPTHPTGTRPVIWAIFLPRAWTYRERHDPAGIAGIPMWTEQSDTSKISQQQGPN
jgi:hypothetical protein